MKSPNAIDGNSQVLIIISTMSSFKCPIKP